MVIDTKQRYHGLAVLEINSVKYAIAQSSVMAVIAAKYATYNSETNNLELIQSHGAAHFLASDKHELKLEAFNPDTQTEILKVVNNLHIGELLFYRISQ